VLKTNYFIFSFPKTSQTTRKFHKTFHSAIRKVAILMSLTGNIVDQNSFPVYRLHKSAAETYPESDAFNPKLHNLFQSSPSSPNGFITISVQN